MSTSSVNSFSVQPVVFKGKAVTSESGIPYYKSNEGIKAGVLLSIPAAANFLSDLKYKNPQNVEKFVDIYKKTINGISKEVDSLAGVKNISKERDAYNKIINELKIGFDNCEAKLVRAGKIALPATLAAVVCTVGTGALIDCARNKKAEQSANKMVNAQSYDELMQNKDLRFDETGVVYHHSKTGKGLGTLLGVGCGLVNYLLKHGMTKNAKTALLSTVTFGLGGLIVGSIYDGNVNKKSKDVSRSISQIA